MENDFEKWLFSDEGQRFYAIEQQRIAQVSCMMSGTHGVQLGLAQVANLLEGISVSDQLHVLNGERKDNAAVLSQLNRLVLAENDALPFKNNEFNVVLAPHLVELNNDPQAALREIYRITAPEGLVLLTGLNPYSLLGAQALWPKSSYRFGQKVALARMKDWLNLLGFDIVAGNLFQYALLGSKPSSKLTQITESIGDRWLPMTAGAYLLLVRKRIFGQTIIGRAALKKFSARRMPKPVSLKQD